MTIFILLLISFLTLPSYLNSVTLDEAWKDFKNAQSALTHTQTQNTSKTEQESLRAAFNKAEKAYNEVHALVKAKVNELSDFSVISSLIQSLEKAPAGEKQMHIDKLVAAMEKTALSFLETGCLITHKNYLDLNNPEHHSLYTKLNDQRKGPFENVIESANRILAKYPDYIEKRMEEKLGPLSRKVNHLSHTQLTDQDVVVKAVRQGTSLGGWPFYVVAALYTPFAEIRYPKALMALKTLNFDLHRSINYTPVSKARTKSDEENNHAIANKLPHDTAQKGSLSSPPSSPQAPLQKIIATGGLLAGIGVLICLYKGLSKKYYQRKLKKKLAKISHQKKPTRNIFQPKPL